MAMRVRAHRWLRQMSGGAKAQLLGADDGHWYVTKFLNNPQGRRILVNDLIGTVLLGRLGIATPPVALVTVEDDFLQANAQLMTGKYPLSAGQHFGSQYPGVPGALSIYDFFPDQLLPDLYNRSDFAGALVADKWLSNADGRQSIFFRAQIAPGDIRWVTYLIDNGYAFQGSEWAFHDALIQGVYARPVVYGRHVSMLTFAPWLDRLMALRPNTIDDLLDMVPPVWIRGDEQALEHLLRQLFARRTLVPQLIHEAVGLIKFKGATKPTLPPRVLMASTKGPCRRTNVGHSANVRWRRGERPEVNGRSIGVDPKMGSSPKSVVEVEEFSYSDLRLKWVP